MPSPSLSLSMSHWALLFACIRSGQLTEAQIAAELRDPAFAAFWKQQVK